MTILIDLYFVHTNVIYPLLHRPTFEKGLAEGLHQRSIGFGATVLLVCAIGSRYTKDPRVMLPDANSDHSAGWRYFDQVQTIRRPQLTPPSLYDLQIYCVGVGPSALWLQTANRVFSCRWFFCKAVQPHRRAGPWWESGFAWRRM